MRLQELVDVSDAVAQSPGRLEKSRRLAELLRRLQPDEIRTAVAFLSGSLVQGRVGIGWGSISEVRATSAAPVPSLELSDVNAAFEAIAATSGGGAVGRRRQLLNDLFARATEREQDFLVRL